MKTKIKRFLENIFKKEKLSVFNKNKDKSRKS